MLLGADHFLTIYDTSQELLQVEQQNRRLLQTRGELSQERMTLAENLAVSLSKLLANAQQMAELLDEDVPVLPEDSKLVRCLTSSKCLSF